MCQGGGQGASGMTRRCQAWVTEWKLVLTTETKIQEGEQQMGVSGLDTLSIRCLQDIQGNLDLWVWG